MGKLIYFATTSLDGYIEDASGSFEWSAPDEEVHAFINDCVRSTSVFLSGRLMYEVMTVWETDPSLAESSPIARDFAQIWRGADKIVYSTTLDRALTTRTSLERRFDPESLRSLKAKTSGDIVIGGSLLAADVWKTGLVDECELFVVPWIVGGGKPALPEALRTPLELLDQRRFDSGVVYLRYAVKSEGERR
jgi:dihydrofolate reductase